VSQYDFRNLSPYDFEVLAHGLMEAELQVRLERFSPGRDSGIDLRCLSPRDECDVVIQCKHYASSSFATLMRALEAEVPKVAALSPSRYLLVTSARLTPTRKSRIFDLFPETMRTPADVYGAEDVNHLLEKHPSVERQNFKLWLTSAEVLRNVLHNEVFVRTRNLQASMEQKARLYVQNRSFPRARDILRDRHVCVIAGVPGIGKTMLADMLLIAQMSEGFEPVSVSDDISEALELYVPEEKQVFYYDDFLGQTTSLDKLGKNEDARLLDFMKQVGAAGNKRLIMTTREYILSQARTRYERLSKADLDITKCVIDLEDYTRLDRAKILYNHVYFSSLDSSYYMALLEGRAYMDIVKHRNYNPRIIETVVRLASAADLPPDEFAGFFRRALENPETIWLHAFENQLQPEAQLILLLLAAMPPEVDVSSLRVAFNDFHRLRQGAMPGAMKFTQALRTLEDNFIAVEAIGVHKLVRFHNPSIRDFVHRRLSEAADEYIGLIESAAFFDQVLLLGNYGGLELTSRGNQLPGKGFPELALALTADPQPLLNAMERTLHSPECGVTTMRSGGVRLVRENEPLSLEERARLVLVAVRQTRGDPPSWLLDEISDLASRWESRGADKQEALELIRELNRANAPPNALPTDDVVRDWFLGTLDESRDFAALQDLRLVKPDIVAEDDYLAAVEDAVTVIESEFWTSLDSAGSAGELERDFDDLSLLAENLGFDYGNLVDVEAYEERLKELQQIEDWEADGDDQWREARDAARAEDAAIDELFETFRDT